LVGFFLATYTHSHYLAPVTGPILAVVMQSLRFVYRWRGRRVGAKLVAALPIFYLILLILRFSQAPMVPVEPWSVYRTQLQAQLTGAGGQHLVIVRYGPQHEFGRQWIYNQANIDAAQVVWARELPAVCELVKYYRGRQIWLLIVDRDDLPPQLFP